MQLTPQQSRQDLSLVAGFLVSYMMRGMMCSVEACLRKNCRLCICGRGPGAGAVLTKDRGISWSEACAKLDTAEASASLVAQAAVRLLLWHWLQPVMYGVILYSWSDKLTEQTDQSDLQLVLAVAVALREFMYFLCSCCALWHCPAYLLVDVAASWPLAPGEVIVSVLMPEKFVAWFMLGSPPSASGIRRFNLYALCILLLDGCSLLALYAGFSHWAPLPPLPLVVCYCITTVSLLSMPCWALVLLIFGRFGYSISPGFEVSARSRTRAAEGIDFQLEEALTHS